MITGHANPEIIAAVNEAATRGLSFGAPCAAEVEMAERLCAEDMAYPEFRHIFPARAGRKALLGASLFFFVNPAAYNTHPDFETVVVHSKKSLSEKEA